MAGLDVTGGGFVGRRSVAGQRRVGMTVDEPREQGGAGEVVGCGARMAVTQLVAVADGLDDSVADADRGVVRCERAVAVEEPIRRDDVYGHGGAPRSVGSG